MAEKDQIKRLDNGMVLSKSEGHYFIQADEEKMEISAVDAARILEDHDAAFDIVIAAKRRYWFNTAMDRYSPLEY